MKEGAAREGGKEGRKEGAGSVSAPGTVACSACGKDGVGDPLHPLTNESPSLDGGLLIQEDQELEAMISLR